jgi:hypothetical protein
VTCPICAHPQLVAIDQAIRAQQAASRRGEATAAPSYSQIAKSFGVAKPALYAHRDGCLDRTDGGHGGPGVGRAGGQESAIAAVDADATAGDAAHTRGIAAESRESSNAATGGVGQAGPPERTLPSNRARARDLSSRERPFSKTAASSVEEAARRFATVAHDIAITDPDVRANGSYVEEVAELVQAGDWEDERSVQVLVRKWNKSRLFVYQCFRDACTLIRIARGTPGEMRETSAARWMKIFKIASQSDDPAALRAATAALQGHDRALGLVDAGTRVQINVMQDPAAQEMLRTVFDVVREDPVMLEKLRARLRGLAGGGELPGVEVIDAA